MAPPSPVSHKPPARPPRTRPLSAQLSRPSSTEPRSISPTKPGAITPPISNLRPRPPGGHSRRSSLANSSTSSPRASPTPPTPRLQSTSSDQSINGPPATERFTGNIENRTEEEISQASREALQNALRKEWADRDKLLARLDELDTLQRASELRVTELERSNETLQSKYDSAFKDQEHIENELEDANDLIELLRSNLAESERQCRLGARRYADQEKAFEAERTVHQADQQHLIQRIKSLTTERIASPGGEHTEAQAALQEELVSLTASHQTLVAQLTTLADQLHEIKSENVRLTDENGSWQLLLEERTLAGTMRGGLIGGRELPDRESTNTPPSLIPRKEPSVLDTLEEQLEMDELHGELDAQQPIFDESDRAHLKRVTSAGGNGSYVDLSSPTRSTPTSLAAELGAVISPMEVETLRNDNKTLKETNKALELYCSKILDRILAQEGYEHILSSDYRTRRGTRSAAGKKSRPSVAEVAKQMAAGGPPEPPPKDPSPAPVPQTMPAPRSRPASTQAPTLSPTMPEAEKEDKERKTRRGFSIDFRALGFGISEKPESKPQLKPLQLASRASLSGVSPPKSSLSPLATAAPSLPKLSRVTTAPLPTPSPKPIIPTAASASVSPVPGARKLEPQGEDEEDRRARAMMEAQLKLLGLDRDPEPTVTSPEPTGAVAWFQRLRPSSNTANTPVLERNDPTPVPGAAEAEAALRAFDAAEKEQARLLEKGKGAERDSYTAPPKMTPRRHRHSASTSSASASASASASETGEKGHKATGSGSTLWSMGSTQE